MAFNLKSIQTGSILRPPRMILLGVEKVGKSTFASGSDKPIFLPIKQEEGIDALDVPKFPTAMTYDQVLEAITSLYQEDHDFGTLVIDSVSALEPVIWEAVCTEAQAESIEKVGGGYGKGYTEALSKWRTLMQALDALRETKNMAIILIGHVVVKRYDDPLGDSFDQYQFDIHAKAANALYRWADSIAFANTKTVVKKEDIGFNKEKKRAVQANTTRYLFTRKSPGYPGGGRGVYGRLPAEIELNWAAYMEAVNNANKEN